jgi:hypothetical protein
MHRPPISAGAIRSKPVEVEMQLELSVIISLALVVAAVAYAAGIFWRQRNGVPPAPPAPSNPKRTPISPTISDREVRAVVSWLLSQAFEQTGIRVAEDKLAYQRIVEAAQKAVNELKTQSTVDVALPYLTADANGPKHLEARLTREMIEELVK